ncbi:MAG: hypothetical protein LBJ17_02285 [Dysgonamonadaceae bacterium]|jgi:hypothetical protein|nr:hypothetical protein [Dysgonamonadaceae bacterium]
MLSKYKSFNLRTLAVLFGIIFLVAACDSIFLNVDGKNADLQGKWKMEGTDTIYFNFQNNLFEYQEYLNNENSGVYGYYQLLGDTAINIEILREKDKNGNIKFNFSLDYLSWDTVPYIKTSLEDSLKYKKLVKLFRLKELTIKRLVLSAEGDSFTLKKF